MASYFSVTIDKTAPEEFLNRFREHLKESISKRGHVKFSGSGYRLFYQLRQLTNAEQVFILQIHQNENFSNKLVSVLVPEKGIVIQTNERVVYKEIIKKGFWFQVYNMLIIFHSNQMCKYKRKLEKYKQTQKEKLYGKY